MKHRKPKTLLESIFFPGLASKGLAILFLLAMAFPASSQAQVKELLNEAQGIVLQYNKVTLNFSGALATAPDEVKGYTAVLPNDIESTVTTFGIVINGFVLSRSDEEADFSIGKFADVNQTPGVSSDDVYVDAAKLESQLITVTFVPVNTGFFLLRLGAGKRKGEIQFHQTSSGGVKEVNTVSFSNTFFLLQLTGALALSDNSVLGLSYTFFAPLSEDNFQSRSQGLGIGVMYFF